MLIDHIGNVKICDFGIYEQLLNCEVITRDGGAAKYVAATIILLVRCDMDDIDLVLLKNKSNVKQVALARLASSVKLGYQRWTIMANIKEGAFTDLLLSLHSFLPSC